VNATTPACEDAMSHVDYGPSEESSNWYVLVAGLGHLSVARPLAPGVTLRPLPQRLTVFDLAAAGAAGFREWAVLEPFAPVCTCEIETARDSSTLPGYDTLNRAWLVSALLVLRGFTQHLSIACSAYSWNEIAGHQERTSGAFKEQLQEEGVEAAVHRSSRKLPRFSGNTLDFHLKMLIDDQARDDEVGEDDARWVSTHFPTFNRLASDSASFRLALEAAVDWRYAKEPRSAVARLWSGIEAMFGISSELMYRIALISASLLEPRGDTRRSRFTEIKRLYNLRSKAVHGEALSEEKLSFAMNTSFRLLRDIMLLTIERGHVLTQADFDDAVFN